MALTVVILPREGDENVNLRMPLLDVPTSRSPLPASYPRIPLQDITNVLKMLRDVPMECESSKGPKKRAHHISDLSVQGDRNRQATEKRIHTQNPEPMNRICKALRKNFR